MYNDLWGPTYVYFRGENTYMQYINSTGIFGEQKCTNQLEHVKNSRFSV